MHADRVSLYGAIEPDEPSTVKAVQESSKLRKSAFILLSFIVPCIYLVGTLLFTAEHRNELKSVSTMTNLVSQCDSSSARSSCCARETEPVLGGVDVVEFRFLRAGSEPVFGSPEVSSVLVTSKGSFTFYFSNDMNKMAFEMSPWDYAPYLGGFDAYAFSTEEMYSQPVAKRNIGPDSDLNAWTILNGQLMFFADQNAVDLFKEQSSALVAEAKERWKRLFSQERDGLFNTRCFMVDGQAIVVTVDISKNDEESDKNADIKGGQGGDKGDKDKGEKGGGQKGGEKKNGGGGGGGGGGDLPEVTYPAIPEDCPITVTPDPVLTRATKNLPEIDMCIGDEYAESKASCCSKNTYPVLGGVDVVAFQTLNDGDPPVFGSEAYTVSVVSTEKPYTFWFSSEQNMYLFSSNPCDYVPAFGGFDALALATETTWASRNAKRVLGPSSDVSSWMVHDDILYLFASEESKRTFIDVDTNANIIQADRAWTNWYGDFWNGLFNTYCFTGYTIPNPTASSGRNDKKSSFLPATVELEACDVSDDDADVEDDYTNYGRLSCCSDQDLPVLGGVDFVAIRDLDPTTAAVPPFGSPNYPASLISDLGEYLFLFQNEENRDKFLEDPWFYAPAYGGFSAFDLTVKEEFASLSGDSVQFLGPDSDLANWFVFNDRLYFMSDARTKAYFLEMPDEFIETGNERWKGMFGHLYGGAFNTHCMQFTEPYKDLEGELAPVAVGAALAPTGPIKTGSCRAFGELEDRGKCCTRDKYPVFDGIDVVAFSQLAEGAEPVFGTKLYPAKLLTSTSAYLFYFSSEENRQIFLDDPWAYAPSWGGFDAYAIATENEWSRSGSIRILGPDPDLSQWVFYEGRLYVFGTEDSKNKWLESPDTYLKEAEKRWSNWYGSALDGSFNTQCFQGYSGPPIFGSDDTPEVIIDISQQEDLELDACKQESDGPLMNCCTVLNMPIMGGLDLVSFRKEDPHPVFGTPEISSVISVPQGDFFAYFSSEENKVEFDENPWLYLPAFGGFDAFVVPLERAETYELAFDDSKPSVDLNKWAIYGNQLYFFGSEINKIWFLDDPRSFSKGGDEIWESWFGEQNGNFNTHCYTDTGDRKA